MLGENFASVPSAQRVIKQELHHVVFREQLRYRRQFVRPDLVAGGVDLIFPLCLPELIAPAETVTGGKHIHRQTADELDESLAVFHWQFDRTRGVVRAKYFRQLDRGKAGSNRPRILQAQRWGELFAVV